jgi:hypothetical protein
LVDALEDATDFWNYGHNYVEFPTYNLYIPTKNTLIQRPKMSDDAADETSYRYNLNRLSPYHYLNTLKGKTLLLFLFYLPLGYKMSPVAPKKP